MNEATAKFNAVKIVSKEKLAARVATAKQNIAVPYGASEEEIAAYQAAINAAEAVSKDDNATKQQVADAQVALSAATEAFNAVKIVNKDALAALVAAAKENIAVPYGASAEDIAAYQAAINAAEAVSKEDNATK